MKRPLELFLNQHLCVYGSRFIPVGGITMQTHLILNEGISWTTSYLMKQNIKTSAVVVTILLQWDQLDGSNSASKKSLWPKRVKKIITMSLHQVTSKTARAVERPGGGHTIWIGIQRTGVRPVFSDESSVRLGPTPGRRLMVRRTPAEADEWQWPPVTFGGGLWWSGGASARPEQSRCVFVKAAWIENNVVLEENLPPPPALTMSPNCEAWFAPAMLRATHTHTVWMKDPVTAPSPDLSPIENIWNVVKRKTDGHKPSNEAESLDSKVKDWWRAKTHESWDSKSRLFHQILISELLRSYFLCIIWDLKSLHPFRYFDQLSFSANKCFGINVSSL